MSFEAESEIKTTLIKVADAYLAFSKLLEFYDQARGNKSGIEQPSVISENTKYEIYI
jgi:UDP-3-O-[3-hydroxymyristoyl] glucosamine N-acyltransferase